MTPDVSVVVAADDGAPALIAALLRQTLRNLEVVVVGAREPQSSDPRVRFEQLPGGAPEHARNRGVALSRAPWILFCDEELERHACKNLLQAAERADADVVCGGPIPAGGAAPHGDGATADDRVAAGVLELPRLLQRPAPRGTLFRRSLLVDRAIAFDRGPGSSAAFAAVALGCADRIAVIPQGVVARRADASTWETDRVLDEARAIDAALSARGLRAVLAARHGAFLDGELAPLLGPVARQQDGVAQTAVDALAQYLGTIDLAPAFALPCAWRVVIYHLAVGDLPGLRAALRLESEDDGAVGEVVVTIDGRDHWGCAHLGGGPALAGRDAQDWLDITGLHLPAVPFSQRRLLHELTEGACGLSLDYSSGWTDTDQLAVQVRSDSGCLVTTVPVVVTERIGPVWRWRADGRLPAAGGLSVELTRGTMVNLSGLHPARAATVGEPASRRPTESASESVVQRGIGAVRRRLGGRSRLRRLALFETDSGRTAQGNARAISEYLHAKHPEIEQAWAYETCPDRVPAYAEPVRRLSARHRRAAASAQFWVDDGRSALAIAKNPRTIAVLAGSGVPVHRLGLDDPSVLVRGPALRVIAPRYARYDLMVAPSSDAAAILQRALAFSGLSEIAGIPRMDDALRRRRRGLSVEDLRGSLDLPGDRHVVIYAPTVRRMAGRPVHPPLDLDAWVDALGERFYLLVRSHPRQSLIVPGRLRWAVRDISDRDDLPSFLAACDLFVSDYSSLIGDAVLADLPVLLFRPDRIEFEYRIRGVYDTTSPAGPTIEGQAGLHAEVDDWLADPSSWEGRHAADRRAFAAHWCGPADGLATERVVTAMLALASGTGR